MQIALDGTTKQQYTGPKAFAKSLAKHRKMSTYIFMKILESAPERYDTGIRILTLGRLKKTYDRLTSRVAKGQIVLDIGCGTGALSLRAASKGARVKGIDTNPQMLQIAEKRAREAGLLDNVELREMGVAELGNELPSSYDAVTGGLSFSELTENELTYTLGQIKRILKPGGFLLIADEAKSGNPLKRVLNWLMRIPLTIITYIITQTTTNALENLPHKVESAGLRIESVNFNKMESFIELVAQKSPAEAE